MPTERKAGPGMDGRGEEGGETTNWGLVNHVLDRVRVRVRTPSLCPKWRKALSSRNGFVKPS